MRGALALVLPAVLAVGCGGGPRQDADEPSGTFKVEVVRASFPARQHIAQAVVLRVRVRNADTRTLDNVAVTVQTNAPPGATESAFGQRSAPNADVSDSDRPVWILDSGPDGGDTVGPNTWNAGRLRAGQSRTLIWRLVAVKAGTYTVAYRVFPGLTGHAKAAAGHTSGSFRVRIVDRPVNATIGAHGQVVRGG